MFRDDDTRGALERAAGLLVQARSFARLPNSVAVFYLRALLTAYRHGDRWSLAVVTRPRDLAPLLAIAEGRRTVVEVGTATAWTSSALVLSDPQRRVVTLDVEEHEHRERYLALLPRQARERIDLRLAPGEHRQPDVDGVDLLFLDGAHDAEATKNAHEAWRPALAPNALVAFHDYGDPAYPGVQEAVERLRLEGDARGRLFVHRIPPT